MRKYLFILFLFGTALTNHTEAQKFVVPNQVDSLGSVINKQYQLGDEAAKSLGNHIERMWYDGTLGLDDQQKIYTHLKNMLRQGLKPSLHFKTYLSAIFHAKITEGLDTQKFTEYLDVTTKVIEWYEKSEIIKYLKTSENFFQYRAIYHNRRNQLFISEDNYTFEFITPKGIEDEDWGDEEEDEYEDENWDENWDDDWDDDWEDDWEEEEEDQTELINAIFSEEAGPVMDGPIIRFDQTTLNIVTKYDSVFVKNTKGSFVMNNDMFVGEGGRFGWPIETKDSVESSEVYADFYDYNFDVRRPQISSNKVLLTHQEKLNEGIDGIFDFKSVKHDSNQVYFPHFTSYNANINIKGLGNDNITYKGGFSLRGHKIYSSSVLNSAAQLDYTDDSGKKFNVIAPIFELGDTIIIAEKSKTTIYNDSDSLYHPSVRFSFDVFKEKLIIQKEKKAYYNTSFFASFFKLNIKADIVKWDVKTDTLTISLVGAKSELATYFESVNHFDSLEFKYMSGVYPFNPLNLLENYSRKKGRQFYVDNLSKKYKINLNTLKSAMGHMDQTGFIKYNKGTGEINLKEKLFHYVDSYKSKKDYDDIIIKSKISTAANAVYNLKEKNMLIKGVKELYLSDPLNVKIEPDSGEIMMTGNRDFLFDGKIIAGNFEYIGQDYAFKYDSFLVHLGHIYSIKLYVNKKTETGRISKVAIDNKLSSEVDTAFVGGQGTPGVLYINRPDNKSNKKHLANYPYFDAGVGAIVPFNGKDILNGAYTKEVYFDAPPFSIDSLNNNDPSSIKFDGTFVSDGIFPVFEEKLHVMDDHSLGFNHHKTPEEGYQLFEGEGKYYGDLSLNKKGIRGNGKIDYHTASLVSESFTYYPDAVSANGSFMEIREEEYNGFIYPQMTLNNFKLHWLVKKDSMQIYNTNEPFQLYNQLATLKGKVTIAKKGVYGKGKLDTKESVMTSDKYKFGHNQFSARHAQFEIKSNNPDKPILYGDNVKLKLNLGESYANISPEIQGQAALSFPYAKMNTSITNARWDLKEQKIFMRKPKNTPLESSYFYTVNKDLDSLSFYATSAEYDINTLEMKVRGIPYIIVADAKITPEKGEVLIHENSKIGQLTNTTIILDTLNGYHHLYDGVIDIISRNKFEGHATYQYVNALSDTFAIQMENFRLENTFDTTTTRKLLFKKKKQSYVQHSTANGSVTEEDDILVSPGFFFKGDMILNANKPALILDGYVKLDFKKQEHINSWVKYFSEGNQQAVVIPYRETITEKGKEIEAGLHFSQLDNSLYSNFLEDKKGIADDDFFTPAGNLFFNTETNEFMIDDSVKTGREVFSRNLFAYNEYTDDIRFEGALQFFSPKKGVFIQASGLGVGNIKTNEYSINSFLSINLDIPEQAYEQMARDILEVIEYADITEGLGDPTTLLYKLGSIIGNDATKAYQQASKKEYVFLGGVAKEVSKSLVFADINLKWSDEYRAFYNEGKLGLSNILYSDINGAFEGFLEIKKDEVGGTIMNLFLKAAKESWYYFGYENERLMLFSSNKKFNDYASKSRKFRKFVFYPGSRAEVLSFITRFRQEYYQIEDFYDLGSEPVEIIEQDTVDNFGDFNMQAIEEDTVNNFSQPPKQSVEITEEDTGYDDFGGISEKLQEEVFIEEEEEEEEEDGF